MKKTSIALLMPLMALTRISSADILLGGDIEINAWQQNHVAQQNAPEATLNFSATVEHLIPIIPNIRAGQSSATTPDYSYTKRDISIYYELLDNDLISADLGVGATQLNNTDIGQKELKGYYPHLFASGAIGIPATPYTVFSTISGFKIKENSAVDALVGLRYEFDLHLVDIGLQAGYRVQAFNIDNKNILGNKLNTKADGFFFGVNLDL